MKCSDHLRGLLRDVEALEKKEAAEKGDKTTTLSNILVDQYWREQLNVIHLAESMLRLCEGRSYEEVKTAAHIVTDFSKSLCLMHLDIIKTFKKMPDDAATGRRATDAAC